MTIFLTVVIVLGIIVAGGFLIYFVADIFMGMSNKDKDRETIANKQERERKDLEKRIEALEDKEELKKDPEIATLLSNGAEVEQFDPFAEEKEEENSEEQTEETESQEEETQDNKELEEEIARRKQALMDRLAILQKNIEDEEEEETEEESEEETADENSAQESTDESTEEQTEEVDAEPEESEAQEEDAEEDVEENSEEQTENNVTPVSVVENAKFEEVKEDASLLASNYTKEELEAKLVEEQERLKANEKDLRASKKEFIPLRRVKKTLEKDENKLRRKEALVAKQKVVLYGVNNYSDIDEEKAKKLAEDLDLLDGLKLSVQHCQEVMEKNQERYPLLEKIYNLLVSQNAEIKENIKEIQEALDSLKNDEE